MSDRRGGAALPTMLPIFPLTGVLLLPRGRLPLNIFEPRYLAMTRDALGGQRLIGMVQPSEPQDDGRGGGGLNPPVYPVGCAGRVTQFSETDDGRFLITLTGVSRFRIREKQALLEAADPDERARLLTTLVEMAATEPTEETGGTRH